MENFHLKKFDITYYHGPKAKDIIREDVIRDIAECGFTLIPLHYDTETNKKALPILKKYGIDAIPSDPRLRNVYDNDLLAEADSVVREVVEDYREFSNVIGFEIIDEPAAYNFPVIAALVNAIKRYAPDKEALINLFPNYATPDQLGNPDYMTHLEHFVNITRPHLLSYDHYHFLGRQNRNNILKLDVDERERLVRLAAEQTENRGGFFENIEDFRYISLKYDIDQMLIVLLTEHGPYRNLTKAEILWEVNMCLTYGMKRISYFTYQTPDYDEHWQWANGMCGYECEKFQHYYDAKEINSEIRAVGEHLFKTKTEAVFHIGEPEKGARQFAGYGKIRSIDGNNGVAGFFEDGSVYIVNKDFAKKNTFTLDYEGELEVFKDGTFIRAYGNEITLEAGAAVLLR